MKKLEINNEQEEKEMKNKLVDYYENYINILRLELSRKSSCYLLTYFVELDN